jgi:hypothetical protein
LFFIAAAFLLAYSLISVLRFVTCSLLAGFKTLVSLSPPSMPTFLAVDSSPSWISLLFSLTVVGLAITSFLFLIVSFTISLAVLISVASVFFFCVSVLLALALALVF